MNAKRQAAWLAIAGLIACAVAAVAFVLDRRSAHPDESSVDAGFARDMAVHHAQAAQMGAYTRGVAPTDEIKRLAAAITHQQQLEIGQMLGWLEAWGLQRTSSDPAMAWMGDGQDHAHGHDHGDSAGGLMPGMATAAEMDELVNLTGKALEIRFLQLMIRHHQGGLPMARYAAEHATREYVRAVAAQMAREQAEEIDQMTHWLTNRGGKTLTAP